MGTGTTNPTATGTIFAYREGFAANGGVITVEDENLTGRQVPTYAGLTTTLSSAVSNTTTTTVSLTNQSSGNNDVNIGDYLIVDNEMMRVKTTVADGDSSVTVFRGVLGSKADSHVINSVVRKVDVEPVELRRHSLIRASGHTFELSLIHI